MALREENQWENYFLTAGIPHDISKQYAKKFRDNRITEVSLPMLDRQFLQELGITIIGDIMAILQHSQRAQPQVNTSTTPNATTQSFTSKPPPIKSPEIIAEMTHPQFRKFKIDWTVYKQITAIPDLQIPSQLYNLCDNTTQTSLINTAPDFLTFSESQLLDMLESIVTTKSNPTIHRMHFASISQHEREALKDYLVRLRSSISDCEYSCPNCQHDLSPMHIRDQFIRGLYNETLQVDVLAKANQLNTLEDIMRHCEAFETAIRDHAQLQNHSEINRLSDYQKQKHKTHYHTPPPSNSSLNNKHRTSCSGCGSTSHGLPGTKDRASKCPAWGKPCNNCHTLNHFAKVCRQKPTPQDSVNALIAHVSYDYKTASYTQNSTVSEIKATLQPLLPSQEYQPKELHIFPDSGATICLAGPQHLQQLNLPFNQLIPCRKEVKAVGGSILHCYGWIPVRFHIGKHTTKQPLYICQNVDRIYFSRTGCTETNILPSSFPFPMSQPKDTDNIAHVKISPSVDRTPPSRPSKLPFPATQDNVTHLEKYLLDQFASSAFNKSSPFPTMSGPPAHIHLSENATPHIRHSPIPVPYHWKDQVKASLDEDVKKGIITPVPYGTPVTWCSTMIITAKKNGQPRRTVDLQKLNAQCQRETHHCPSPFQLACQIPPNTKKTVLDAVDGYHAVPLDKESQPLTSFITEWGRYMYLRAPQGYLASGDAYTRRYDDIIKDIPRKVKCVDDTALYDDTIESAFYHTWDYLELCAKNGIVLNSEKFQFCRDTITFAGLTITPTGITPSPKLLDAIKNFPTPTDITGARSWFGLVNQVSWAYSISPIMQPFRDLVKHNTKFHWDDTLEHLFQTSKELILSAVTKGIQSFDPTRQTCLQTDWSKTGIGYLLLQKYCKCAPPTTPICCQDGWRLVYAGSRFTSETESRYSPTEGEALAVAWSLEHARMFVLGCESLTITTDHQPLLGIFCDRDLGTIANPRLQKLKGRTLRYQFTINYCPGKWLRGPDAVSRFPSGVAAILSTSDTILDLARDDTNLDSTTLEDCNTNIVTEAVSAFHDSTNSTQLITIDQITTNANNDTDYKSLVSTISSGFPDKKNLLPPHLRVYWDLRSRLSTWNDLALLDHKIIIPVQLRHPILQALHSAHQGCTNMKARANQNIYWPGLNRAIHQFRDTCKTCIQHTPTQPKEPIILSPQPQWPFQMICADYFTISGHTYMVIVDRYSGWLCIYHFGSGNATSTSLINELRTLFTTYGAPEEFSSDGGPQFTSSAFQQFLVDWGVRHRLSSAEYPQSNGRAELGVKAAKRILYNNISSSTGSINNDKVARAILQYRNTPLPNIQLSPGQILFHRQLRDHIPSHPSHYRLHQKWIISAKQREEHLSQRDTTLRHQYDKHSQLLTPLPVGTPIIIQNRSHKFNRQWLKTGFIVEVLPNRQYKIRMHGSGRITLQNRRFIRQLPNPTPTIHVSPTNLSTPQSTSHTQNSHITTPLMSPEPSISPTVQQHLPPDSSTHTESAIIPIGSSTTPIVVPTKSSRILQRIASHNAPGLQEQLSLPRRAHGHSLTSGTSTS